MTRSLRKYIQAIAFPARADAAADLVAAWYSEAFMRMDSGLPVRGSAAA
jgi:hypothetical protein